MNQKIEQNTQPEMAKLVDQAVSGDKAALEKLLTSVQDLVFNLSLRMLGTIQDAEEATQEILIKVMTHLATFRKESAFSTWVFRIASNYLQNYKKSMFSKHPLSFAFYGADIASGKEKDLPDYTQGVDSALLEQELKLSCSNVMLQCLDAESRCIFILGAMFQVDSRVAGDILGITPEAYRQRLSRIKKKMAAFLDEYCGLSGKGMCACKNRVNYAIASRRLNPAQLEYSALTPDAALLEGVVAAMEQADDAATVFSTFPHYRATAKARDFLRDFLQSDCYSVIINA